MMLLQSDIVILPHSIKVPDDFPYSYHQMKFLHTPSIVSLKGFNMSTQTAESMSPLKNILSMLGLGKTTKKVIEEEHKDIFYRHIRVMNEDTGEFYHNRGATVLVDLRAGEGRFFFSFAVCNHQDNFNKSIAHHVCKNRMENGEVIECINYDPSISILQNIYLAIGVMEDRYPLTDMDWTGILPELYGTYTKEQRENLGTLRRLIRDKAKD